jgi:hypothetical protein
MRGDPMSAYSPALYEALHAGIRCITLDLKTELGQRRVRAELAKADLMLSAFRPSALKKLDLRARPKCRVMIFAISQSTVCWMGASCRKRCLRI